MFGKFRDYSAKDLKKHFFRQLKKPLYTGNAFHCPVCDAGVKGFIPIWKSFYRTLDEAGFIYNIDDYETFNRHQYACPSCDASDRERLYALYIRKWLAGLDRSKRLTFIDFAPAMSISSWLRGLPFLDYKSADLFRHNVDIRLDITDMPQLANDSVDAFLCSHVLEHVPNDRAAMEELHRVLKPGGFGIVMVPLIKGVTETREDPAHDTELLRTRHYGLSDHLRMYGTEDFVARLQQAGFRVDVLGMDWFGEAEFRKAGIAPDSRLHVVKKPAANA